MAKLNISVCDLCKKLEDNIEHSIQLAHPATKKKIKAEICNGCFDTLANKIIAGPDLTKYVAGPALRQPDGIVPSSANNISRAPLKGGSSCEHQNTSFDRPFIICKDCGHKESI